jgi:type I restriction enzyme S subunit
LQFILSQLYRYRDSAKLIFNLEIVISLGISVMDIKQVVFKRWFVDFEPTRAKVTAKKRWLAINDIIETSSSTCYAGEFDYLNTNTKKLTLKETMTQAAMVTISGKSIEELEQLSTKQLEQLKATADLFPDELIDTELGEIPRGWENQPLDDIVDLVIASISKESLKPLIYHALLPSKLHDSLDRF